MENKTTNDLHNQEDVNPGSELDKVVIDQETEATPKTDGTGGNRPVQTESTVIIKEDTE